ncbi:MAG: signal recognition particle protein [Deferribacterota bacterium]|nr:signal recognition particle protein [Deferribacterota bacterium]
MFKNLSDRLQNIFKKIKGEGKLSEDNIKDIVRQIKLALLEADVNYKVVKRFVDNVKDKALGAEVVKSLTPDKVFVKIVHDELVNILGGSSDNAKIRLSSNIPTNIMLVGLQGSGKTTTAVKLACQFKGKKVLLTAADVYRAAAIQQLEIMAKKNGISFFSIENCNDPIQIAESSVLYARRNLFDINIIDTAGRLHIDSDMMDELVNIKNKIKPDEILLVVDSMVGQDAINQAVQFDNVLDLTGVILTKLDSDARGGAALSIREVIGKPIKYASTGEKVVDFEPFYPDRMASRILDMGDIVSLVEKAQNIVEKDESKKLEQKLKKGGLDFNDLVKQLKMIEKMGSIENVLKLIPGFSKMPKLDSFDDKFKRVEAIVNSMTPYERRHYKILNSSRKKRIARGSGTNVKEVNRLIEQLVQMNKMLKVVKNKKGKTKKLDSSFIQDILSK